MPYVKKDALTGMDLLRLALERSGTAEQALETIVQLLSDHGQGGLCGYEDKSLVYHNSYIIADPRGAWVLETAGPLWAALRVREYYSISNGLTIGEAFDRSHPDLISTAREKGWLKKGGTFHFAHCFSDWFYTTFSACKTRQGQSSDLLAGSGKTMDTARAFRILRDHRKEPYRPNAHFLMNRVCMHAANSLSRNSQSTASLAACLSPEDQTFWATGTSAPCTGIFKPIWFDGEVLPDMGAAPGADYDPHSLWWRHEALHRSILMDYPARMAAIKEERDRLEAGFLKQAEAAAPENRFALTQKAFQDARAATENWIETVQQMPVQGRMGVVFGNYWKTQNKKVGLAVQ
jgi:dipeptidase